MNILLGKPFGDFPNDPLERHVESLAAGLRKVGCSVQVVPFHALEQDSDPYPGFHLPALVHVFHAVKGGIPGWTFAHRNRLPLILTVTGTDVTTDTFNPGLKDRIYNILMRSDALVAPYSALTNDLDGILPNSKKVRIIPPSLPPLPSGIPDIRQAQKDLPGKPLLVAVGGFSAVRNLAFLYPVLTRVKESHPDLCMVLLGDPVDASYSQRLEDLSTNSPFIRVLRNRTMEEVLAWIKAADIVIDVSHAIDLPALTNMAGSMGRPLVLPDIPGWRSLYRDERAHPNKGTAYFYDTVARSGDFRRIHDSEDCAQVILSILEDPKTAFEVANRAQTALSKNLSPEKETCLYHTLYREILR